MLTAAGAQTLEALKEQIGKDSQFIDDRIWGSKETKNRASIPAVSPDKISDLVGLCPTKPDERPMPTMAKVSTVLSQKVWSEIMSLHLVPRGLRYVLAVADHGSVQAASRAIGIAASAIDRQIHALEDAGQSPLFERQPRGMRLTPAGEALVVLARRWQADADRMDTHLTEMRGQEHGIVHIAAMDSLANSLLPDLVGWVHRTHPRIHLAIDILTPSEAAEALRLGTADVTIAFNIPPDRNQHRLWYAELPFGCAMSPDHALAKKSELDFAALDGYPTVVQNERLPIRQRLENQYSWFFKENLPILSTNSLQLLKRSVVSSNLALITSELDVLSELENGELVFVPLRLKGLKPQTVSVVIDTRRALLRASRVVSEQLVSIATTRLENLRGTLATEGASSLY